jgi:hypothetical protein
MLILERVCERLDLLKDLGPVRGDCEKGEVTARPC